MNRFTARNHPHGVMREPCFEANHRTGVPMLLLIALVLLIVVPSPWNVIGALATGAFGVVEVVYWQRRMRGEKVQTGVENLVGATGEAAERLAPSGQVRVLGEIWQANSSSDLPRGAHVRVVAVNDLTLEVEAVDETEKRA
jgi:membrane protein implicated in regulation of membrane protease activity